LYLDGAEQAAPFDLAPEVRHFVRRRPVLGTFTDRVVVLLNLLEERIEAGREDVMAAVDYRESTAPPEDARRLLIAHCGIDPSPRGGGEDEVKLLGTRLESLKRSGNHLHVGKFLQLAARDRRETFAQLDTDDVASTARKRARRLASAASDFEDSRPRPKL